MFYLWPIEEEIRLHRDECEARIQKRRLCKEAKAANPPLLTFCLECVGHFLIRVGHYLKTHNRTNHWHPSPP